ncbi:hypothetical protein MUB23_00540 [Cuneatibacter sp. NSJ-177]|uniref:hypothetical protein n=1 Tax=Cuneatibacter sp. NSJ-177 TaxID=2931401 RepID=UPI001FD38B28|nr:hypothetical protein [Cuneatibacter sp. NSJ-177]MCJ7833880.1 hypothetical protein [Cuneatibacter sp. NSJ-177]
MELVKRFMRYYTIGGGGLPGGNGERWARKFLLYVYLETSGHVKRFLHFLDSAADSVSDDELLVKMNLELEKVRNNEEWRREYMTLLMELNEREARGLERGRREAIIKMLKNGLTPEQVSKIMEIPLEAIEKLSTQETT